MSQNKKDKKNRYLSLYEDQIKNAFLFVLCVDNRQHLCDYRQIERAGTLTTNQTRGEQDGLPRLQIWS